MTTMSPVQPSQAPISSSSSSSTTAAATAPGQKPPKLRLSCDACAAAKVKCSKEHPRCERCIAGSMTCVYGPSRKHGKPQHKRKQQQDSTSSAKSIESSRPPSFQQRDSRPPALDTNFYPDLTFDDLMKGMDGGMFDSSNPTWFTPVDTPSGWSSSGNTMIPTVFDSPFSTVDDMFQFDSMSSVPSSVTSTASPPKPAFNHLFDPSTNSSMDFSDFVVPDALSSTSKNSSVANLADMHRHSVSSTISSTINSAMGSPMHSPMQQPTPPVSRTNSASHDCYALAYSTLATLHYRSQPSGDITMSEANSPYSATPSLDNLLRNNKAAINNVLQLLQCSCAGDPHMAMLYASITSKILLWYQVAAGVKPSSTAPTPCPEPRMGSTPGTPLFGATGGCAKGSYHPSAVSLEPVRIGSFSPDKEDQEPMRRVLLLSELKKAGQLIDALSSMQKDHASIGDASDWGAGHIYAALGAWLKSELLRTVRDVKRTAS